MARLYVLLFCTIHITISNTQTVNITGSYVCDETNNCQDKTIVCAWPPNDLEAGASCDVHCNGDSVCLGATMISLPDSTSRINIYCNGNMACANAKIFDSNYAEIRGSFAAQGAIIHCEQGFFDRDCKVQCIDELSCGEFTVNANNTLTLDLQCQSFQSCHDITIYCPLVGGYKSCGITGNKANQVDVHNNFNIYSRQGWWNVDFHNYNSYTLSGKMVCALSADVFDECDIRYGVWDCVNTSSLCSAHDHFKQDRESIVCNADNPCNSVIIECTPAEELSAYPACNIFCDDNSCNSMAVYTVGSKETNIICGGNYSCSGLTVMNSVNVGEWYKHGINIVCGRDGSTSNACQNAIIWPPYSSLIPVTPTFEMNINTFGPYSLWGARVIAPKPRGSLYIQCNYNNSCQSSYIEALGTAQLMIQCNGDYDSCSDLDIRCPDEDTFMIGGDSIDRQTKLRLQCRNSWADVDKTQWKNVQIIGEENWMVCNPQNINFTYGGQYTCRMNEEFDCECGANTSRPTRAPITAMPTLPTLQPITAEPTLEPTRNPSILTTEEEEEGKNEDVTWFIIGVTFLCLFVVALLLAAYAYYNKRNDEDKIKQSKGGYHQTELKETVDHELESD